MNNNTLLNAKSVVAFNSLKTFFQDVTKYKYSIIKGDVLSVQAYGNTGMRFSTDIDMLISRKDLLCVENFLFSNGLNNLEEKREKRLAMLLASHQSTPWKKQIGRWADIIVDINIDIFWGEYEGKRIDIDEFLSDTVEMDIYGVKVKTLPPIKAMVQLVLHHYKDMNSIYLLATRKSIKYDMFKDVYYLLKNNIETIPLHKLYAMSTEFGIIPYIFYVLYYTGQVFDDEILNEYIEAFRTPEGEALLNCYGLCDKERKEWKYDFQTRLETNNLYDLIKDDLTEKDIEKIRINKRIFMGVSE